MIGEKWGRVLHIDHDDNGVNSLTFARLLVSTKARSRIDACIRMEWETGSCDVWVKETRSWECKDMDVIKQFRKDYHEAVGVVREEPSSLLEENTRIDMVDNLMGGGGGGGDVCINKESTHRNVECDLDPPSMVNDDIVAVVSLANDGDDTIAMCKSCPVEPQVNEWFDPISSVECSLSLQEVGEPTGFNTPASDATLALLVRNGTSKRQRGRPKKVACSLPVPLFVPSPPSNCNSEAHETWNMAKSLGVKSSDEEVVIAELRKSKRIMAMVENPAEGN
ncbi:unnamed protein product [Amaranthus hypochondriacus]